jgi:hypothetical protein
MNDDGSLPGTPTRVVKRRQQKPQENNWAFIHMLSQNLNEEASDTTAADSCITADIKKRKRNRGTGKGQ